MRRRRLNGPRRRLGGPSYSWPRGRPKTLADIHAEEQFKLQEQLASEERNRVRAAGYGHCSRTYAGILKLAGVPTYAVWEARKTRRSPRKLQLWAPRWANQVIYVSAGRKVQTSSVVRNPKTGKEHYHVKLAAMSRQDRVRVLRAFHEDQSLVEGLIAAARLGTEPDDTPYVNNARTRQELAMRDFVFGLAHTLRAEERARKKREQNS